jgi:hypothetical protein
LKENKKKQKFLKEKKIIDEFKVVYVPKYGIRTTICVNILDMSNITQIKECTELLKNNENFEYKDLLKNVSYFRIYNQINQGEIDEDTFVDEDYIFFLYENNNILENNEIKIPIYFVFSNPEGKLELSEYPRLVFCESDMTLREFRKKIYLLIRKHIYSPFINFQKEKVDDLSKEIAKYRKDKSIGDDYIFNLIEEEYERIFSRNLSDEDIMCLREYMGDIPFQITLRELMGTTVIKVFEHDNMNELTKEFKELTEIDDIYACINEILSKLDDFVVSIEFNYDSKFINLYDFKIFYNRIKFVLNLN